ncbi:MAG: iron ABC transporter permease [Rhodococcus fascians]
MTTVAPEPATRPVVAAKRPKVNVVHIVGIVLAVAFAALLLYPFVRLVDTAFIQDEGGLLGPFDRLFAMNGIGKTFTDTILVVCASTALAAVVAVMFAWLNTRTTARLGFVADILPLTPVLVPVLAGTVGWVFLLSPTAGIVNVAIREVLAGVGVTVNEGPVNVFSMPGVIALYTLNIIPFIYLPVSAALSRLDPALEEASRVSGRNPFSTFVRVTIPAVRPAIAGGVFLGALIGLGTFSIAVIVGSGAGVDMLAVRVYRLLTQGYPPLVGEAVALAMFILAAVLGLSFVQRRIVGKGGHATIGGKGIGSSLVDLRRWKWPARIAMIGFIALSSVIPLIGLVYVSLRGYWTAEVSFDGLGVAAFRDVLVNNPLTKNALANSVQLAALGALVTLLVATVFAIFVGSRTHAGARALDALAKAPGGMSHLMIAIAFLIAFAGPPFRLSGSMTLLLLAFVVFFMPQAYVSASSSHSQISAELTEASAISGAGPGRTLRRVTVPLMIPGLVGGAVMIFVMIMSEVTGSALLSGTRTPVIGFVMLDLWSGGGTFATIAALGVVMTVITMTITACLIALGRRSARR